MPSPIKISLPLYSASTLPLLHRYSISSCQRLCLQKAIQAECGCSHPLYDNTAQLEVCDLAQGAEQVILAPDWSSSSRTEL